MRKDTILVAGATASGKTKFLNLIRNRFDNLGLTYNPRPHSDSHTIIKWLLKDDQENQGKNHYHEWCPGETKGHVHVNGEPIMPFTVAGNFIPDGMMDDFFRILKELPFNKKIYFAEWAGGRNINRKSDPASLTDLSFASIADNLLSGRFNPLSLNRVLAVIHIKAENNLRYQLNRSRGIPTVEDIEFGRASFRMEETGMNIFGIDDFEVARSIIMQLGVTNIYDISNDGDDSMEIGLENIFPDIIRLDKEGRNILPEGNSSQKER